MKIFGAATRKTLHPWRVAANGSPLRNTDRWCGLLNLALIVSRADLLRVLSHLRCVSNGLVSDFATLYIIDDCNDLKMARAVRIYPCYTINVTKICPVKW